MSWANIMYRAQIMVNELQTMEHNKHYAAQKCTIIQTRLELDRILRKSRYLKDPPRPQNIFDGIQPMYDRALGQAVIEVM